MFRFNGAVHHHRATSTTAGITVCRHCHLFRHALLVPVHLALLIEQLHEEAALLQHRRAPS
jgi:hypothetical protein